MAQTDVFTSSSGVQLASSGTIASLCFNESKARDFEKLTDSQEIPARNRCKVSCAVDLTEVFRQLFSTKRDLESQRTHSHLLCAKALGRCIVVITSSSNIHRTRRPGMKCVFASLLNDQMNLELTCSWFGACRAFVLVALSALPGRR